ncbi:hypothetical protein BT67DRAFT_3938 [Trichocladium antarcticum]|uniref:Uncharacterized protein n=1 Tax=Trichocladium antarcticum TaxID=1450529 RepID=A0AAN6UUT1_9PEZI|nr:hypothetical protein BT67DRAFT_3938 [Trichocladium antarcticum]
METFMSGIARLGRQPSCETDAEAARRQLGVDGTCIQAVPAGWPSQVARWPARQWPGGGDQQPPIVRSRCQPVSSPEQLPSSKTRRTRQGRNGPSKKLCVSGPRVPVAQAVLHAGAAGAGIDAARSMAINLPRPAPPLSAATRPPPGPAWTLAIHPVELAPTGRQWLFLAILRRSSVQASCPADMPSKCHPPSCLAAVSVRGAPERKQSRGLQLRGQPADASCKTRRNQLRERRASKLNPLPSLLFLVS